MKGLVGYVEASRFHGRAGARCWMSCTVLQHEIYVCSVSSAPARCSLSRPYFLRKRSESFPRAPMGFLSIMTCRAVETRLHMVVVYLLEWSSEARRAVGPFQASGRRGRRRWAVHQSTSLTARCEKRERKIIIIESCRCPACTPYRSPG